jgi:hypothetical protein
METKLTNEELLKKYPEPPREEGKHRFMAGTCVDCGRPLDEVCTANLPLPVPQESEGVAAEQFYDNAEFEIIHNGLRMSVNLEIVAKLSPRPSLVETAEEIWKRAYRAGAEHVSGDVGISLIGIHIPPYTPPSSPKPSSEKE